MLLTFFYRCYSFWISHHYFADVSGSSDGSIRLWEWGVGQPFFTPRIAGQYAKVCFLLIPMIYLNWGYTLLTVFSMLGDESVILL